jgi:hypothetical protein
LLEKNDAASSSAMGCTCAASCNALMESSVDSSTAPPVAG